MTKRAEKTGRRTEAARQAGGAEDRLVDAALALAAQQGWRDTGLGEIAAAAGLRLDEAYAACRSKPAILVALHRRIDRAALADSPGAESEPWRDRLFDVLMRRFDALKPHRAALRVILRDSIGDPAVLLAAPALMQSMAWMIEAAGLSAAGWGGRLRTSILAGLYLSVLRVFLTDDSGDLTKTMAALDRGLRRAEALLAARRGTGGAPAAADG